MYSPIGDANRNRNTMIPGYVPNPHGFYEDAPLPPDDWAEYRGRAVKVIHDNLHAIPPGERLRVVYMRRDPQEIRRSYVGIMSGPHPRPFAWLDGYAQQVDADIEQLSAICASVAVLSYADVVRDPVRQLTDLEWPLDVSQAAATIDAKLYRHRGAA